LHFIHGLTRQLLAEKSALEASPRAMGKTNDHGIGGVASVELSVPELDDATLSSQIPGCDGNAKIEIRKRLEKQLLLADVWKIDDEKFYLGLPNSSYETFVWEKYSFDDLIERGFRSYELKSAVAGGHYFGSITLEKYETRCSPN
jgi:hypothetical protein